MADEKLVPKLRFAGFDEEWEIKLDELSKIQIYKNKVNKKKINGDKQ